MNNIFKILTCAVLLVTGHSAVSAKNNDGVIPIKVGIAIDQGFGVAAQIDNKINVFIGNDGLSGDYLLKTGTFNTDVLLNWYVGVGGAFNWGNDDSHHHSDGSFHDDDYNQYSVRVPFGVVFPFEKKWDVYGHIAPDLTFNDKPHDRDLQFGFGAVLGIRYDF